MSVSGAAAVDADGLHEGLGYMADDVSAAIVSLYLETPTGLDSPLLGGELRAVPIDRTGFATPLPATSPELGGDARCYSAGGVPRTPILRGELALE